MPEYLLHIPYLTCSTSISHGNLNTKQLSIIKVTQKLYIRKHNELITSGTGNIYCVPNKCVCILTQNLKVALHLNLKAKIATKFHKSIMK